MNDRMEAYDPHLLTVTTRLDCVDRILAMTSAELNDLRAKSSTPLPASATSASSSLTSAPMAISMDVNDVAKELALRAAKKVNIVITGLTASATSDSTAAVKLIHDELHMDVNVISCARLAKPGTKPQLLLVTLADEKQASAILRVAKNLRDSTDAYVHDHIFINEDLTQLQRTESFNARAELKRRRAASETNLVIRNGSVVKKTPHPYRAASAATPASVP